MKSPVWIFTGFFYMRICCFCILSVWLTYPYDSGSVKLSRTIRSGVIVMDFKHKFIFGFAGIMSLILLCIRFLGGFGQTLKLWPILWITLAIDTVAVGCFISYFIWYEKDEMALITLTSFILTLIPGIPGVYFKLFGKGWDDLTGVVLLYYYALPLFITTIVSLILWIIKWNRKSKKGTAEEQKDQARYGPKAD